MPDPNYLIRNEELDDVDRLFARLDRAPAPVDLTARVLASTVARSNATRTVLAWPWLVAGLLALGLLSVAGYLLGSSLAAGDGLEVVGAVLDDLGLLTTSPGDVVAALGEVVPLGLLGLALLSGGLWILAAGHLVARVPRSLRTPHPTA
jgi:hypothetical protein